MLDINEDHYKPTHSDIEILTSYWGSLPYKQKTVSREYKSIMQNLAKNIMETVFGIKPNVWFSLRREKALQSKTFDLRN